jgi:hypothetical protein
MSLARFPCCASLAGRPRTCSSRRLHALDLPVERPSRRRLVWLGAGRRRPGNAFPRLLAHDLGVGACRSSRRPRRGGGRHLDQRALPAAERIAAQDCRARVACGELFAPVDCFGRGRRLAGAQSEAATAARIGGLPIALAARRRAKRFLRALEPDAWNVTDRDRRRRGSSGPLPRYRATGCGQSGGGRAPVHPGGWR